MQRPPPPPPQKKKKKKKEASDFFHKSHSALDKYNKAQFWNRNVHICARFCYNMVHYGIFFLWHV